MNGNLPLEEKLQNIINYMLIICINSMYDLLLIYQ